MKCNECNIKAPIDNVLKATYLIKQFKNIFLCNHCILKITSWIGYKNEVLGSAK